MNDDPELLRRYAESRSEEAFAELVRRNLGLVYAAATRRLGGDADAAKDVAQVVFTDLARNAAALSRRAELASWLYTSTHYAAAKRRRAEQRRQAREQEAYAMKEISSGAAAEADWTQLRPVVDDALLDLSGGDRQVILMRFFQGQRFGEIGRVLGASEDAVRMRVERALDKLRAALAQREVTSTTTALGLLLANQAAAVAPAGLAATVTGAALAGAAATGSGAVVALKFLNFMSTTKIVGGIAGVAVALAVGSAVYQASLARESATAVTSIGAERDELRARLSAMEKRAQASDDSLAATQKELGELRAAAAKPAETPASRPAASQSGPAMDYVLDHPETQATFVEQRALRAKAHYDRFLKASGLSAEQQEQFLKEMKELSAGELDFMAALHAQGLGVGNLPKEPQAQAVFQKLLGEHQESARAIQNNLHTLMGDELFKRFQQYTGTIPERNVADQVAAQLYYTDTPLTAPQADQLAQVLAQNRFSGQPKPSPTTTMNGTFITPRALSARVGQVMQQQGMTMIDWLAPVTDAAVARAQTVLTPAQLAALQQVQAQQVTQIQLAPPPPGAPSESKPSGGK